MAFLRVDALVARIDLDQFSALSAVQAALLAAFTELDASNVVIANEPHPDLLDPLPSGEHFLSVCPGGGSFPEGMQDGGGAAQCTEESELLVSVYSRVALDQSGRDPVLLGDSAEGLLPLKRRVLKALVSADPQVGSGNHFVRDLLIVRRAAPPQSSPEAGVGWITLTFGLNFDWDLS